MKTAEQVDTLKGILDVTEEVAALERCNYRVSDAIREGAMVSEQMVGGFTNAKGQMCAMSAGIVAARARGYMK